MKTSIQLDPEFTLGHCHLGLVVQQQGESGGTKCGLEAQEEAERPYEWALALNPNDVLAHVLLGKLLHRKKMSADKAEDLLKHAIELDPCYSFAHQALGGLLENTRQVDRACRCYLTMCELSSADSSTSVGLWRLGLESDEIDLLLS